MSEDYMKYDGRKEEPPYQTECDEESASAVDALVMRFRVTEARVGAWHTDFTLHQIGEDGEQAKMGVSPKALIHQIGQLCGKELNEIEGVEFQIVLDA